MKHPLCLGAGASSCDVPVCTGVEKQEGGCEVGCPSLGAQVVSVMGWE